jgi:hypothetical protein
MPYIPHLTLLIGIVILTIYLYVSNTVLSIEHDRLRVTLGLILVDDISYDSILNCERVLHYPGSHRPVIDPIDNIIFTRYVFTGRPWLAVHHANGDTRYIPVKDSIDSLNILVKAIEAYKKERRGLPERIK